MSRAELIATRVVAGVAGISMWLSLGALVVTENDTRMRLVALPVWGVLLLAIAVPVATVWWRQPRWRQISPLAISALIWLPFVPGAIPPAFLIWHGPIEIGVWFVVAAGLLAVNAERWATRPRVADSTTAPWIAALAATIAFIAGAAALRAHLPIGDEPHYLMITQSVLKDGDLRIENNYRNRDYASFYSVDIPPHYLTRGRDGEIYSSHAPGTSIIVLPGFAMFGYYGAVGTVLLCVALASAVGWRSAWMLTRSSGGAWLSWAAVFLTAPIYLHAVTVFPEGPATLPVIAATWLLVALELGHPVQPRTLVFIGGALSVLPWLHSRLAVIAVGLGLAIVLRLFRSRSHLQAFLAVPLVAAIAWFGFFWLIWGSASPIAPWGSGLTAKLAWVPRGVTGLLLDQQAGLIPSAPVYVCALAGWPLLLRRHRRLAIETALVGCTLVASVASYDTWWGGQGGPARYIVAALPLAIPAIAMLAAARGSWGRQLTGVSALVSVLLLVSKMAVDGGSHTFFPEGGVNPLLAWMSDSVDLAGALPSLTTLQGAHFAAVDNLHGLGVGAMWAAAALAIAVLCRVLRLAAAYRFTATALASAGTVMLATSLVWQTRAESGLLPLESALSFVRSWHADWQPVDFQWRRPYLTSPATVARRVELSLQPGQPVSLPAGRYEVWVDQPAPAAASELTAMLGDSSLPLARWPIEAKRQFGPLPLGLPIRAESLRFETDHRAQAAAIRIRLAAPPQQDITARAVRASGIGDVRVFFADRQAYAEPTGFWIPPQVVTRLVVDRPDDPRGALVMRIQAGPIATTVDLEVDGQRSQLQLGAAQSRELRIPVTAAGAWHLTFRPEAGFRPVDFDPAAHDERKLGVWVEVF